MIRIAIQNGSCEHGLWKFVLHVCKWKQVHDKRAYQKWWICSEWLQTWIQGMAISTKRTCQWLMFGPIFRLVPEMKNLIHNQMYASAQSNLKPLNDISVMNQPVVGWLERLWYPSSPGFKFWCSHLFLDLLRQCAFSGRWRFCRWRGAYGDIVNLKMICRLSLSEVLIGVGCACVHS